MMNWIWHRNKKLKTHTITLLLRQLSELLSAGMTLMQSLTILEHNQTLPLARMLIYRLKTNVAAGNSFCKAVSHYPAYFDSMTCQLIRVGEHTGKLESMLELIANYKEATLIKTRNIKQALFYPLLTLGLGGFITLALLYFVVPKFAGFFADMKIALPLYTKILFSISNFLHAYLSMLILFVCSLIFYFTKIRIKQDILFKFYFTLPFLKQISHKNLLAHFSRILSMSLNAGIPLVESLTLVAETCPTYFSNVIKELKKKTLSGTSLHASMQTHKFFPSIMIQMIEVGEESGRLISMLDKITKIYDDEVTRLSAYLTKTVEPLIMLVLGALIGGLVLVLYLPIFELGSAF